MSHCTGTKLCSVMALLQTLGSVATPERGNHSFHLRPMQEFPGAAAAEELHALPGWETFYQQYVRRHKPVILRDGAQKQPAMKLWTERYLSDEWGEEKMAIIYPSLHPEDRPPSKQIKLKRFFKLLQKRNTPFNHLEKYAISRVEKWHGIEKSFVFPEPVNCKEHLVRHVNLIINAGGHSTGLHMDPAEQLLIAISGNKSVMLASPDQHTQIHADPFTTSPAKPLSVDLNKFPRFVNVSWLQAKLLPGDVLYIPAKYYHQVNSVGRNIAISLGWSRKNMFISEQKFKAASFSAQKFKATRDSGGACSPVKTWLELSTSRQKTDKTIEL